MDFELFSIEKGKPLDNEDKSVTKKHWNKIGVGFLNSDDSINIIINMLPYNKEHEIQLRPVDKNKEEK